jgi:hypothetical protein
MDCAAITNTAGLAVSTVGAGLIWKFGLPAKLDREGHQRIILEQIDEEEKAKAARFDRRSGFGFGLLIVGFIIQAVSNLI